MEKSGTEEMRGVLGQAPPTDFLGSETEQAKTVLPRINGYVWLLGPGGPAGSDLYSAILSLFLHYFCFYFYIMFVNSIQTWDTIY